MAGDPSAQVDLPLARLDRLLEREILRLRARYQLSLDEFRGLYVSDEQVDRLVRGAATEEGSERIAAPTAPGGLLGAVADRPSRWAELAARFALQPLDLDLILLALAPEIDLKYETLYAYLNNDVTRKWPTLDLAQRLLGHDPPSRASIAAALSPAGRLAQAGILERVEPPAARPSLLNAGFALTALVTQFLSGLPLADPRLIGVVEIAPPHDPDDAPADAERVALLHRLAVLLRSNDPAAVALVGERGSGRRAGATAICRELGIPMMQVHLDALGHKPEAASGLVSALALYRHLQPAGLYLDGLHACCGATDQLAAEGRRLVEALLRQPAPVFAACDPHGNWRELLRSRRTLVVRLDARSYSQRLAQWERQLARAGIDLPAADRRQLADRLALSPGQIADTVATAHDLAALAGAPRIDTDTVIAAARQQTDQTIGKLALKVESQHGWDDLVLPPATRAQLRELAARHPQPRTSSTAMGVRAPDHASAPELKRAVRRRRRAPARPWRPRSSRASSASTSTRSTSPGSSASTSARPRRTSTASSRRPRAGNAMLFFDEADALFGKRSEVKDAHDRYANIEVALPAAAAGGARRRRHPRHQPAQQHRRRLRAAHALRDRVPAARRRRPRARSGGACSRPRRRSAPTSTSRFLARQFELAGGDIRNVALDAAFLAAEDGRLITMEQLVRAMARQLAKQGRMPSLADFRQFHGLVVDRQFGVRCMTASQGKIRREGWAG